MEDGTVTAKLLWGRKWIGNRNSLAEYKLKSMAAALLCITDHLCVVMWEFFHYINLWKTYTVCCCFWKLAVLGCSTYWLNQLHSWWSGSKLWFFSAMIFSFRIISVLTARNFPLTLYVSKVVPTNNAPKMGESFKCFSYLRASSKCKNCTRQESI